MTEAEHEIVRAKFQSRCWLELRCNFGSFDAFADKAKVSEQMLA